MIGADRMRFKATLFEIATGRAVAAEVRPTVPADLLLWAAQWVPQMSADAGDVQWDWALELAIASGEPDHYACYSLHADGQLQGLRLLEVSQDDVKKHGTHSLLLSSAPWNRGENRKYRGVGKVLVATSILRSQQDGHKGRTHCASLPTAASFHEANGMKPLGQKNEEGYDRYRFRVRDAEKFLRDVRAEGYLS